MLTASAILNEAHHKAVGFIGIDDNGRDGLLLQLNEGLEPPLAADEIILRRFSFRSTGDGDRALQADLGDVFHHIRKCPGVSDPWIENPNAVGRDQGDFRGMSFFRAFGHQATSVTFARPARA